MTKIKTSEVPTIEGDYYLFTGDQIDSMMNMKHCELKLYLFIFMYTDGPEIITLDEFENGKILGCERVQPSTGLTKTTIINGLRMLEDKGLIEVIVDDSNRGRLRKYYCINEISN